MSNQQTILTDILAKRRDRALAVILGVKEREVDPFLSVSQEGREASMKLRKVVLDQINELNDLSSDLMRSLDNDVAPVLNEFYLRKLEEIKQGISEIKDIVDSDE